MMRAGALMSKELRLLWRDRHGLAVLFLMPTVFILIMSLAMQDAFDTDAGPPLTVRIDNADEGPLAGEMIERLLQSGAIRQAGENVDFALAIPADFSARLLESPDDPARPLLRFDTAPTVLPQARAAFDAALTNAVLAVQGFELLELLAAELDDEETLEHLRVVMDPGHWHLERRAMAGERLPSSVQQNVPAWLVFAMFFVVVPLSVAMITERSQGTAMRLQAMSVPAGVLLATRVPPYLLVNLLQAIAMVAVGIWLVPRLGGEALALPANPLQLLPIILATGFAAIALALMIAVIARTAIQAIAIGALVNLVMAAAGGIMVPKMVMPAGMQAATVLSPMSWALEGFWDILLRARTAAACVPEIAMLCAFGLVCLTVAAMVQKRNPV